MKVFAYLLVFLVYDAAAITYKYMDMNCGGVIDVGQLDSVRLQLTLRNAYKSNMDCRIRLKTDSSSRLMFYFKSFSVESSLGCTNDWLRIYDGSSMSSPSIFGLTGKQCGFYISSSVFKTTGNTLYLWFKSDSSDQFSGFDMIVTSYHTGYCNQLSCTNGRCISESLSCNGYNPCGDYSDCSSSYTGDVFNVGAYVGIVAGTLVFTIVLTVIIIIVRRRRLAFVGARILLPIQVVSTTETNEYNQPLPQQYPQPPPYTPQPQ